jgi:hypothetical protein
MSKLYWAAAAGVFVATLIASAGHADGPDISAHRLVESWHDEDPGMRMVAEVIASPFASGFSWGGRKRAYYPSSDLKGGRIMSALEQFLKTLRRWPTSPTARRWRLRLARRSRAAQ